MEWRRLAVAVRRPFKAKLAGRLRDPRVPSAPRRGAGHGEIAERRVGWATAMRDRNRVVAVGKRERNEV